MSLAKMLAAHNDTALEGLASKGLVRRARRDVDAGSAEIVSRTDKDAVVRADGETVEIDGTGPTTAKCGCPASGVCRHRLMAVMALQLDAGEAERSETSDAEPEASVIDAKTRIESLTTKQVEKFAGADWAQAAALAASDDEVEIEDDGAACRVQLNGGTASVTFIAGQGLKGAAYKGPSTKKRLLVTTAALLIRRAGGAVEGPVEIGEALVTLPEAFITDALKKIEEAVTLTLASASPLSADLLFDLAISARAEAAPRLTSTLRGLARLAALAPSRHVDFEGEAFLRLAARAYALLHAIRAAPDDSVLTGTLRRNYEPAEPLDAVFLGASIWSTPAGARGITAYGLKLGSSDWVSTTTARGAGMDPYFSPREAYSIPIWSAGSMAGMMGKRTSMPAPRIDPAGAIAPSVEGVTVTSLDEVREVIEQSGAVHRDWSAVIADVTHRMGQGLRRGAAPVPVLIAPSAFGDFGFDDFRQVYDWEALDEAGRGLRLQLDGDAPTLALQLRAIASKIKLMLVEVSFTADEVVFHPVSLILETKGELDIRNIDLEGLPRMSRLDKMRAVVGDVFKVRRSGDVFTQSGLDEFLVRVMDAAVTLAGQGVTPDFERLCQDADTLALTKLETCLRAVQGDPTTRRALKLAYIVSELRDAKQLSL